jgi:nucleotide-binding universal stress UspA family protein
MSWMFPDDRLGRATEAITMSAAPSTSADRQRPAGARESIILACVNSPASNEHVLMHSLAIGRSLGLPVTLARVLEAQHSGDLPADPIEWQMRLGETREGLDRLAASKGSAFAQLKSVILAGPAADELTRWAKDHHVALMVLATTELPSVSDKPIGGTALSVLRQTGASVLLVPPVQGAAGPPSYRRVLVPLDGSPRAESVLPVAIRIARELGSELLLATAVPRTCVVENLVIDADTRQMCQLLEQHNERSAHQYIDEIRARFASEKLAMRGIVRSGGDPRPLIRQLALDEHADLVVMSSHGKTGLADVPIGSVAEYMATHAPAPLLLLRSSFAEVFNAIESSQQAIAVAAPVGA